jgi:hypothetical protein
LFGVVNQMWTVCAVLCNLQKPIISIWIKELSQYTLPESVQSWPYSLVFVIEILGLGPFILLQVICLQNHWVRIDNLTDLYMIPQSQKQGCIAKTDYFTEWCNLFKWQYCVYDHMGKSSTWKSPEIIWSMYAYCTK